MDTLTIRLPDDQIEQLKQLAKQLGITPEKLAAISIEQLVAQPNTEFDTTLDYVLKKNKELYQRLSA